LRVGQDATHSLGFNWQYNATPASAYAELNSYGYTNSIAIDFSVIKLQTLSNGTVGVRVAVPSCPLDVIGSLTTGRSFAVNTFGVQNYGTNNTIVGENAIYNSGLPGWTRIVTGTAQCMQMTSGAFDFYADTSAAVGAYTPTLRMRLTVAGALTLPALSTAGILHNSAAGLISTSLIVAADIGAVVNTSVIPKGGAANASLVASSLTDDGTTVKTTKALGVGTSSTPTTAGVIRCDTGLGVGIDPDGNWIVNIEKDQNAHTSLSVANANNHASAYGRITVWGATNYLSLISTPALGTYLGTAGLSGIACVNTAGFQLRNVSNTDMTFKTNDTVRMTIAAAGDVIIGTGAAETNAQLTMRTAGASGGLHIVTATADSVRWVKCSADNNAKFAAMWQYGSAAAGTLFGVAVANAARLSSSDSSSLLIGTVSTSATYLPIYIGQSASGGDRTCITVSAAGNVGIGGDIDVVGALMANSLGWDNVQIVDTSAASPISVTPTCSRIEVPGKGSGMDFTIALQAGALVQGTILAVSFIGAAYDLTIDSDGADVVLDAKEGCLFIKSSIGWLPLGGAS
jgi:hypothetical protein